MFTWNMVIYGKAQNDRGSVDRISIDIFTWSNFLIKRLKIIQLIEKFDQLPKKNGRILAVDQNFY